jgi:tetratricopeptide (TPR) repeat protein
MRYLIIIILFNLAFNLKAQDQRGVNGNIKLPQRKGNTYAIIIGINNYKNITPLNYASIDAKYFYELLLSPVFKVKISNISLLTDSLANRFNIYNEMYELQDKLLPNDLLLFYFAGHGDIEARIQTNNSLLLLADCPSKNYLRSGEYLDMNTLKEYFISLTSKKIQTFFISDACHAGNLIGGMEGQKITGINLQQIWSNEIKLLSCQPDEFSQEGAKWGKGRGAFSYYLEYGLKGLADNGDNILTLGELKKYLESNVAASTNDRQNPLIMGDPKTFICNVDPQTLASVKKNNNAPEFSKYNDVTINRGIYNDHDSLFKKLEIQVLSKIILPINQSAISTGVKILTDSTLKGTWKTVENVLFKYCSNLFDQYMQFYYDGKPMQAYKGDITSLKDYLNTILPLFKNKQYTKDIYIKSKFINIFLSTLSTNKFEMNALSTYIVALNEIKKLSPASPFIYKKLNEILFASGMIAEGYDELNSYTALLPNDAYAYNFAGMAFYQINQNEKAVESLKKAIQLKENYFNAYYNLGVIYMKMGKKKEANEAFEKAKNNWD